MALPVRGGDSAGVNGGMESQEQIPGQQSSSHFLDLTGYVTTLSETDCPHSSEGPSSTQADGFESLQLEFQDSRLSPTLRLFPQDKPFILSESSLLHQTDSEFVPLRGSPDLSIASERCPQSSHLRVDGGCGLSNTSHEQASLSQHPLAETAVMSRDDNSCCTLSQHSLSSEGPYQTAQAHEEREKHVDADVDIGDTAMSTLRGVCVASSSAVSPASEAVLGQTGAVRIRSNSPQCQSENEDLEQVCVEDQPLRPSGSREQPQGGSSPLSSRRYTVGRLTVSSSTRTSVLSNVTVRSLSVHSDHSIDPTHREPQTCSHTDASVSTTGNRNQTGKTDTSNAPCDTPANGGVVSVAGLQRARWSPSSQTAADGSFLTSQPVSQSTPAVLPARWAAALTPLSPVCSLQDTMASPAMLTLSSNGSSRPDQMKVLNLSTTDPQTITGGSFYPLQAHTKAHVLPVTNEVPRGQEVPYTELHEPPSSCEHTPPDPPTSDSGPPASDREIKNQTSVHSVGAVCSLPSLSYLQKIDAWKAGSSTSFYDRVASQGFDDILLKKQVQNSESEALNCTLPQQHLSGVMCASNISTEASQTGGGPDRRSHVMEAGAASTSPPTHSHSSLGTVVTSAQQGGARHNPPFQTGHSSDSSQGLGPTGADPARLTGGVGDLSLAQGPVDATVTPSPFPSPAKISNLSSSHNMNSTLSSSQGSCHGEQNFRASVGVASSVVSLEVDNYAPYWTSRPGTPPQTFELNIDDRIPLYLHNLGIDQSPSTILNPFTLRGPIREPEFSPTDLCTIKGSVGTPTKSTQPSEGDSPQKETFSSSSMLSADSIASLTPRLAVQKPDRPASQGSVRMDRCQAHTPPQHLFPTDPLSVSHESDTPQREGSYGQLSSVSAPPHGASLEVNDGNSSLVGSKTLQEIRRLLGSAGSPVSGHSSLLSSPGSHSYSESNTSFLSLRQNMQTYHDDSSLSLGGRVSLVLARSSSDSALKESSSSSYGPLQLSRRADHVTTEPSSPSRNTQEDLKSRDLRVAPRRAEPEGCSAADPDKMGPLTLPVTQGNAPAQDGAENAGIGSPENSPTHSPAEVELDVLSDGSSESSIAVRVAKLLHSESPVSMITSRPSTSDPEESRAREWILMKVSGHQCESIELNAEDRRRIDEIKQELLLYARHNKWSSDSEGSAQSSVDRLLQPAEGPAAVLSRSQLSDQPRRAHQIPRGSNAELHPASQDSLETRIHQIALRESPPAPTPLASITIASVRRTPSPQSETQRLRLHDDPACAVPEQECSRSPTHTAANEGRPHSLVGNGGTEMDRKGIMGEAKKGNGEDKHQDLACEDVPSRPETPPSLESGSGPSDQAHVSHVHLTLSPKPQQNITKRPPLHHTSRMCRQDILKSSRTSKEENTPVPSETSSRKERQSGQNSGTAGGCSQISSRYTQTFTPLQRLAGPDTQTFTPLQRLAGPDRPPFVHTAPVPTLLPYKPQGSSELFYMPQTNVDLSHFHSDSSIESSHPGSDDALPPHFSTEVLGSREMEDRNITPRHKEGIYSRKANMRRDWTLPGRDLCGSKTTASNQSNGTGSLHQHTLPVTAAGLDTNQGAVYGVEEKEEEVFVPLHMEADYSTDDFHHGHTEQTHDLTPGGLPEPIREEEQGAKPRSHAVEIGSSLDQLWHRFSERWSLQEDQPANKGDVSLLERLERLSRLLHSSSSLATPAKEEERSKSRRRGHEPRQMKGKEETRRGEEEERNGGRAIPITSQGDETSRTNHALEEDRQGSGHQCPAERDESTSVSAETTGSQSTIDVRRLLGAFRPRRVGSGPAEVTRGQTTKTSSSLLRLYNTINKQKRELSSGVSEQTLSPDTQIISTDDSTASSGSLSSSNMHTFPFQRATMRTKRSKVKQVSRGIQAGDLEIVVNGTRRHTRDVGTTFPSPGCGRGTRAPPLAYAPQQSSYPTPRGAVLGRGGLHKSNQTSYPDGVSWFVSADELKRTARKENDPHAEAVLPPGPAWFQPYSRTRPWREAQREPLRERHIQGEQETTPDPEAPAETTSSSKTSALIPLSLREALELRRPEFVSRSRERMKRLCLVVEERKMQAVFNRERDELFSHPAPAQLPSAAPAPLPSKRVIPVREMVRRSKRVYSQLPEVKKRREDERRKAEYSTYRLNAQLFNKKVTNRVLGRRTPWQ
ncbi:ALMS1 centrosome and basal body associated protein isoform X2 [Brachyhypopomus gauderio]|uniref:ALMS1 centrosome and basal body associated protein isoform X2 n=1 Tax=Brachyhypopomus gauderio TaxID=698409 RepID=UPI0040413D6F